MPERLFTSAAEFRDWLKKHHASAVEVIAVLRKKGSASAGIVYAEALDEALCFGWIDGVRKNRDTSTYTIRFTPRRRGSIWSRVNVAHAQRLLREGRMEAAGRQAFASRAASRTGVYSFENRLRGLSTELERIFQASDAAWNFFQDQPAGYKKVVLWWVMSAKQEATKARRLDAVIKTSAKRRRVDLLKPFG